MNVLEEIMAAKAKQVEREMAACDCAALRRAACHAPATRSLRRSLAAKQGGGIIAEFKRRSPSKGDINAAARPADIVPAYEAAGAAGISVLADNPYFGGCPDDVAEARACTSLPILYKEFVLHEYQIWRARVAGADAILLIAAAIGAKRCVDLATEAHNCGLEVLLEIHDAEELDAYDCAPDILGVNNRDLKTFVTSPQRSIDLLPHLPADAFAISESGLLDPADARRVLDAGYRGLLVGEAFMRTAAPGNALREYIAAIAAPCS